MYSSCRLSHLLTALDRELLRSVTTALLLACLLACCNCYCALVYSRAVGTVECEVELEVELLQPVVVEHVLKLFFALRQVVRDALVVVSLLGPRQTSLAAPWAVAPQPCVATRAVASRPRRALPARLANTESGRFGLCAAAG